LFIGDAIGVHFSLLHWAKCSIGFLAQNEGTQVESTLK
jgi:hypothetical protein